MKSWACLNIHDMFYMQANITFVNVGCFIILILHISQLFLFGWWSARQWWCLYNMYVYVHACTNLYYNMPCHFFIKTTVTTSTFPCSIISYYSTFSLCCRQSLFTIIILGNNNRHLCHPYKQCDIFLLDVYIFCAKEKESYYPIQQRNLWVQTLVNLQTRRDTKYIHTLLLPAEL